MTRDRRPPPARTFFLNEQHELARAEKESGGRLPRLAPIDWRARGQEIHRSLSATRKVVDESKDPVKASRYFFAAVPTPKIRKLSEDRRRAPDGVLDEKTDYAGRHSQLFKRLGLDLLGVDEMGQALVHAPSARLDQLLRTAVVLAEEGPREQARWIAIQSFSPAPPSSRIDREWLQHLAPMAPLDAVVELQPLLSRVEVEQVIHAIMEALGARAERERFTRTGTDFSGRHWYRGELSRQSLELIAKEFFSVQAVHPPLRTPVTISDPVRRPAERSASVSRATAELDAANLPVVGVVDVGVPAGHLQLGPYRRGGYLSPNAPQGLDADHGSMVASRVVFGDPDFSAGLHPVTAGCAFIDINVAEDAFQVDDKAVLEALQAVVATYPQVRVFNLSFGEYPPLSQHLPVIRSEKLVSVQDLDNFVFRSDVLVVVAAGNSRPGIVPVDAYPFHVQDPQWGLGSWACGFNTLTCGSFVGRLSPGGLVKDLGWPSPFTRIGPGLCDAPIPEFSANGGNCTERFEFAPGLGVYACTARGLWEDRIGTSLAAPLLAREAAFALAELQRHCEQGARPFAATIKAFFALTAEPPAVYPESVQPLAERTLGRGVGSVRRLRVPREESAVMIWQGVLAGPEDKARLQIPIPRGWLQEAACPILRVVVAWESPVNSATEHLWASRKVEIQLRPVPLSFALTPTHRGARHGSYPLVERTYRLKPEVSPKAKKRAFSPPEGDFWLLELSYTEIAEYQASVLFSPHQRVGIAFELSDEAEVPSSPQAAMQALPQAVTMARLAVPENRIANPVVVRSRV